MDMLGDEIRNITRRIQAVKVNLMRHNPFYAYLLLNLKCILDFECETAYTDGKVVAFSPVFIWELSDTELEFILMHEVMHCALGHCTRGTKMPDQYLFNIACDIVVNSNILESFGGDVSRITLRGYGESMHLTPKLIEGWHYTAEEVYEMLVFEYGENCGNCDDEILDEHDKWKNNSTVSSVAVGADEEETSEEQADADCGCDKGRRNKKADSKCTPGCGGDIGGSGSEGQEPDDTEYVPETEWRERDINWIIRACEAARMAESVSQSGRGYGSAPAGVLRAYSELLEPKTDWKTVLNDFVQEEINDYSFSPPDRRFQDSMFLLPDYNEKDNRLEDILFMIDTSGSMSKHDITECFSEIKGALDQFDGKLHGWLGFFDAAVIPPKRFEDVDKLLDIRAAGGGGTRFDIIFDYVNEHMDKQPVCIIILTDGYAPYPEEKQANGIPVLWVINNKTANPPFGRIVRLEERRY